MPTIEDVKTSAQFGPLKNRLKWEPTGAPVDVTVDVDAEVDLNLPVAQKDAGHGKWAGIRVWIYNFAIGVKTGGSAAVGDDDPQYIGLCKCPAPEITRSPEYTDAKEGERHIVDRTIGTYGPLNGDAPVRFAVMTNAFNNDSSEAWDGIVKALGGDLTTALQTALALGGAAVPGLSAFATPGAVGKSLVQLINDALTDDPEQISDDVNIVDTVRAIDWYRKIDQNSWLARKWVVHTLPGAEAWYLSQWFVELSTTIKQYDYAMALSEPATALELAMANTEAFAHDIAAVRILRGESAVAVAESSSMTIASVETAVASLRSADAKAFVARTLAALLRTAKL